MTSDSKNSCITCGIVLGPNYWHRGACGHHQHEHCALPAIRAGKGYCPRCPQPTRPTAIGAGTVVLGSDSEQISIVAAQLRTEREVNNRFATGFGEKHTTPEPGGAFLEKMLFRLLTTNSAIGRCKARDLVANCSGGYLCMHDVHDTISRAGLRCACVYRGLEQKHKQEWLKRLKTLLESKPRIDIIINSGVSIELLAFCKITIGALVGTYHYRLESLIEAFHMTFADLCLLGFSIVMFRDIYNFPLIALYDKAGMRAEHLFALEISFTTFKKHVLDVDRRHAILLDINEQYWRRILGGVNK